VISENSLSDGVSIREKGLVCQGENVTTYSHFPADPKQEPNPKVIT